MKYVAIVVVVLLAGLLETWVKFSAQNHPARVAIVGGVVALVVAAVLFLFPSGPLITLAVFLVAAAGWGWLSGLDSREKELSWYCRYGAQTQAQVDDCMANVDTGDIEELDTPAARFAYGQTAECGRGSGPFCAAAAKDVALEYDLEPAR